MKGESRIARPDEGLVRPDVVTEVRYITASVPGVWTLGHLRKVIGDRGHLRGYGEAELDEELSFALSYLIAGHEAERLGFDSFRIHPFVRA